MLHYVTRELHAYTIEEFLDCFRQCHLVPPDFIRPVTYETLLANKRAPIGNYVFTDLDRMTGYELDAVTEIARALSATAPEAIIANWPNRVLGRYPLLRSLKVAGVNSFDVWRLDEERVPSAYPVFIRREQDAFGPESDLLHTEAEYRSAVEALQTAGKGLAGRIAVEFRQRADDQGLFRKYGAFCFGNRIVPHHLFLSKDWNVKRSTIELSPAMIEEEEHYVFDNPHADQLLAVFQRAQIDFGRADYALVDGRIEIFEINTNPSFPRMRLDRPARAKRRHHSVEGVVAGFRSLDPGISHQGLVKFRTPKPKLHRLRARSIGRRLRDIATGIQWRLGGLLR